MCRWDWLQTALDTCGRAVARHATDITDLKVVFSRYVTTVTNTQQPGNELVGGDRSLSLPEFRLMMEEAGGALVASLGLTPDQWQKLFAHIAATTSGQHHHGRGRSGGGGGGTNSHNSGFTVCDRDTFLGAFGGYLDEHSVLDAARDAIYLASASASGENSLGEHSLSGGGKGGGGGGGGAVVAALTGSLTSVFEGIDVDGDGKEE